MSTSIWDFNKYAKDCINIAIILQIEIFVLQK